MANPIVIVGAGQAGVQVAESLRQEGYGGELLLLGAEPHAPYQRPPLSKKWLSEPGEPAALAVRGAEALQRRNIQLRTGAAVVALERAQRRLQLADGTTLHYERLALATGARPRHLPPADAQLGGVFTLRTIEDCRHIGAALKRCAAANRTVAVVGGGFIGLEVAAAARKAGAPALVFESLERLLSRVTAPIVSAAFARLHAQHGVQLVFGARVAGLASTDGQVSAVRTADGARYPVGCVVVGTGVVPDDALAAASGLACERGVIVDDCGRSADPYIVAAGDCTARRLADGRLVRLESVQNAVEQGKSAAAALMQRERPFTAAPWFWSDQFEVKLQMAGLSQGYDTVVTRGDVEALKFSAYYFHAGRLIAADSLNCIQDHMNVRKLLERGLSPSPQQAADTGFALQSLL